MKPGGWLAVAASDYEGHMGPAGADQLAPLRAAFAQIYSSVRPRSLLMLGCATGNGLEHLDARITQTVVGVDIHPGFLQVAHDRYAGFGGTLRLQCARAQDCAFEPATFELVHAALFFEWVEPESVMGAIARWLSPGGVLAAIVQLPSSTQAPVTPSRFTSVQGLGAWMRLVAPEQLQGFASGAGLAAVRQWNIPVAHGKLLKAMLFRK